MLDLALTLNGNFALAASTDRTVTVYDLRGSYSVLQPTVASLPHPATPSCLAPVPSVGAAQQILSGAYDGVVRLWDLRSVKSAITSFQAWDYKKILSLDSTSDGIVCVGGEGGVDIWRIGEESDRASFVKSSTHN